MTNELSHAPLGPSVGVPAVDVCAAVSLLANSTEPPTPIVTVAGMKQSGSQLGLMNLQRFQLLHAYYVLQMHLVQMQ